MFYKSNIYEWLFVFLSCAKKSYNTFKVNNNVWPKVTQDEIIETLNDFGNDFDRAFYLNHLDEVNKGNKTWGHIDYDQGPFKNHPLADFFNVRVANQQF